MAQEGVPVVFEATEYIKTQNDKSSAYWKQDGQSLIRDLLYYNQKMFSDVTSRV
jgi:hypothetical protein